MKLLSHSQKSIKAKDADSLMKLLDVPFVYRDGGLASHKDADALKAWLKMKLGELKDTERVPTAIDELMPFVAVKEKIKDATERALAEEVMGKDGFLAVVTTEDGKKVGIAVRLRGGKAKIVGLIR